MLIGRLIYWLCLFCFVLFLLCLFIYLFISLSMSNYFCFVLGVLLNLRETKLIFLLHPLNPLLKKKSLHSQPIRLFSLIIQKTSNSLPFKIKILLLWRLTLWQSIIYFSLMYFTDLKHNKAALFESSFFWGGQYLAIFQQQLLWTILNTFLFERSQRYIWYSAKGQKWSFFD